MGVIVDESRHYRAAFERHHLGAVTLQGQHLLIAADHQKLTMPDSQGLCPGSARYPGPDVPTGENRVRRSAPFATINADGQKQGDYRPDNQSQVWAVMQNSFTIKVFH